MKLSLPFTTFFLLSCILWTGLLVSARQPRSKSKRNGSSGKDCQRDESLLVYKVTLTGLWSRETFPSHNENFKLFRMDEKVTEGVRLFAETGTTDVLNDISQGGGAIFDEFNAPPIPGVGETEAEFFVDGNHSRVSLMSRLVPSPDWFVGLDNIDLCNDGTWVSSLTIEGYPLDAGTDNGLTFTSPNWRTEPYSVVTRLTTKKPNHPASSFFYSDKDQLPPIALFQFIKVKAYELSQVFNLQSLKYDTAALPNEVYDSSINIRPLESTLKIVTPITQSKKPTLSNEFMTYLTQNDAQGSDDPPPKKKIKRFRGPRNSHQRRHHRPLFNWTESL